MAGEIELQELLSKYIFRRLFSNLLMTTCSREVYGLNKLIIILWHLEFKDDGRDTVEGKENQYKLENRS